MGPPTSQISCLLTLINQAARTLESGYNKDDGVVPSLDQIEPHALDGKLSAPDTQEAIQILEGACAQLCATLARPNHTLVNKFFLTALEPSSLHVAFMFNIPDVLQETPSGMHVNEIAQRCGTEPSKLARILRLLSAKHCFREVEKDVFANNRLSVQLLSSNPLRNLGLHMTGDTTAGSTKLAETLADPEWGHSFIPAHSPWNKHTSQPLAMFDYWASNPDMRQHGERFGIGMIGWSATVEAATVVHAYPWKDLATGATVCDLGGGVGTMAIHLARAHPSLQLKLQDIPDRVVQAETVVWPTQCPEAIRENRIEFKAVDFFRESPIAGCDVYYLKNIIHVFPTAECLTILEGVRKVMKPASRVLIHEYILQTAPTGSQQFESDSIKLDVSLMVHVNGRVRTLDEYIALGEQAGLRFIKVWEFGDLSGMEFCAKENEG
ncbi:S-adenosyl-L-methionine-dependent methyltransferase [Roridomyces roridus]|uniref:S-adenosyl-L-methionine-dependent methyltransferase n=1 Tax=Roridomyces roridus TaxID=1738132 RepID=A0AAD7FTL8_9AGAR|nr:S-adenosyl-L-methionine-dependent methyltransferase [Roridomyces roridus]